MKNLRSETFAWVLVILWAVTIFVSIPLARWFQSFVQAHFGRQCFTVTVLVLLAALGAASVRSVLTKAVKKRVHSLFWLAGLSAVYTGWTLKLSPNPEESLHLIEYGVLGVLIFHALSFRIADRLIYLQAFLIAGIIGTLDEIFQWLTPNRVFDYRDIMLNAASSLLMLLVVAKVWRPDSIRTPITPASIRKACTAAIAEVLILTLCLFNTAPVTKWLTGRFPQLGYLLRKDNLMSEYGHLVKEGGCSTLFYSRFSPDELRLIDEKRGQEIGEILKSPEGGRSYQDFLQIYSPVSDPFAHEIRVHLFRRDQYLAAALNEKNDEAARRSSCTVAHRENMILEKYFGRALQNSSKELSPGMVKCMRECADDKAPYESKVSRSLIVDFTQPSALGACALIVAALVGLRRRTW